MDRRAQRYAEAKHVKRYRDIAKLLFKYGRADLVKSAGLEEALLEEDRVATDQTEHEALASQLADDLEAMGPTFIKLGQLLSTRPDIVPPVADALAELGEYVRELEERVGDAGMEALTGDEIAEEFQKYLRRRGGSAGPTAGSW